MWCWSLDRMRRHLHWGGGGGGVLGSDSDGKLVTYKVLIKQRNIL